MKNIKLEYLRIHFFTVISLEMVCSIICVKHKWCIYLVNCICCNNKIIHIIQYIQISTESGLTFAYTLFYNYYPQLILNDFVLYSKTMVYFDTIIMKKIDRYDFSLSLFIRSSKCSTITIPIGCAEANTGLPA